LQADCGAQAVQIFDSWASHLAPQDFDVFAGPYIKRIIDDVKSTHPDLPIILYISGSGAQLSGCHPVMLELTDLQGYKLGGISERLCAKAACTCS
jgi:uroporphyrinogen decarboxylase